jgi:hypothetical protein
MKISVCAYMDINGDSIFHTGSFIEEELLKPLTMGSKRTVIEPSYLELLRCGCSAFYARNEDGKWCTNKDWDIYRK